MMKMKFCLVVALSVLSICRVNATDEVELEWKQSVRACCQKIRQLDVRLQEPRYNLYLRLEALEPLTDLMLELKDLVSHPLYSVPKDVLADRLIFGAPLCDPYAYVCQLMTVVYGGWIIKECIAPSMTEQENALVKNLYKTKHKLRQIKSQERDFKEQKSQLETDMQKLPKDDNTSVNRWLLKCFITKFQILDEKAWEQQCWENSQTWGMKGSVDFAIELGNKKLSKLRESIEGLHEEQNRTKNQIGQLEAEKEMQDEKVEQRHQQLKQEFYKKIADFEIEVLDSYLTKIPMSTTTEQKIFYHQQVALIADSLLDRLSSLGDLEFLNKERLVFFRSSHTTETILLLEKQLEATSKDSEKFNLLLKIINIYGFLNNPARQEFYAEQLKRVLKQNPNWYQFIPHEPNIRKLVGMKYDMNYYFMLHS